MKFICFIALISASVTYANELKRDLMGITVRWESPDEETRRLIAAEVARVATEGAQYYDPDCLFRKPNAIGNCSNAFKEKSEELTRLTDALKEETQGYFDIHHRKLDPLKRDFGGVWQGHAIDELRKLKLGAYIIDFSGDIFLSDSSATGKKLIITDPVFDELSYATLILNHGFMIASVSKKLGGKVRVPDALADKADTKGQILKVVLFASPEFSGARLDAWSTGVIAGGTKVLEHLETLKEFHDEWTYFYFDLKGKPHCAEKSSRISCDFESTEKIIKVRF